MKKQTINKISTVVMLSAVAVLACSCNKKEPGNAICISDLYQTTSGEVKLDISGVPSGIGNNVEFTVDGGSNFYSFARTQDINNKTVYTALSYDTNTEKFTVYGNSSVTFDALSTLSFQVRLCETQDKDVGPLSEPSLIKLLKPQATPTFEMYQFNLLGNSKAPVTSTKEELNRECIAYNSTADKFYFAIQTPYGEIYNEYGTNYCDVVRTVNNQAAAKYEYALVNEETYSTHYYDESNLNWVSNNELIISSQDWHKNIAFDDYYAYVFVRAKATSSSFKSESCRFQILKYKETYTSVVTNTTNLQPNGLNSYKLVAQSSDVFTLSTMLTWVTYSKTDNYENKYENNISYTSLSVKDGSNSITQVDSSLNGKTLTFTYSASKTSQSFNFLVEYQQ